MYPYDYYLRNEYESMFHFYHPQYYHFYRGENAYPYYGWRQQPMRSQATWTDGGEVTSCGLSWSQNNNMTVAVSYGSPFQCGQRLKVRNLSNEKELVVIVVDHLQSDDTSKITLHKKAFEALGENLETGIIHVEVSPEIESVGSEQYLLPLIQSAYPNYHVVSYEQKEQTELNTGNVKETIQFILQSNVERIVVEGSFIINPRTNRVVSFEISEL
ncbi:RlpA-like double-psi beta-barrel domain-containing protein [Evansella cellulosilytica]|uniref:Uncharacterized protein n=1 Tax=Evansella cellulosilytica (strain ATCC 21833 / DSM 2522 / FERM P-1141 / JCM 9156 / N-4) TaxID=649639 RepID=E6TQN5_EVAC2|nr:RlpA-like double-psi beta-barrel domain-containing protein [Evansella cellulosilytica]ADU30546.1 hypothetical protein Bcell_2286 [Evansella cellulosilytica DSM 2522]